MDGGAPQAREAREGAPPRTCCARLSLATMVRAARAAPASAAARGRERRRRAAVRGSPARRRSGGRAKPQGGAKAAAKRAPKAATKASKAGAASKAIARKPKSKAKAGTAKAGAAGAGPTRTDEAALWASGVQSIAGVDEAGRGPLAGPVVAAACVLPRDERWEVPEGLDDSKQMSEARASACMRN